MCGAPLGFEGLLKGVNRWCGDQLASYFYQYEDERLWGIAVATPAMVQHYATFPEVIQMDGTYRINRNGYVLYHVIVTDNHGHSQSVLVAFVSAATQSHISWVVERFRFYHGEVAAVRLETVLVDKDY